MKLIILDLLHFTVMNFGLILYDVSDTRMVWF